MGYNMIQQLKISVDGCGPCKPAFGLSPATAGGIHWLTTLDKPTIRRTCQRHPPFNSTGTRISPDFVTETRWYWDIFLEGILYRIQAPEKFSLQNLKHTSCFLEGIFITESKILGHRREMLDKMKTLQNPNYPTTDTNMLHTYPYRIQGRQFQFLAAIPAPLQQHQKAWVKLLDFVVMQTLGRNGYGNDLISFIL